MIWKKLLEKQKKQTHICKNCFNDINFQSFHKLFSLDYNLCDRCLFKFDPIFKFFKIDGVNALAIYKYDDQIKDKIYLYKGCEDYELKDIFVEPFKLELEAIFDGYKIVPIPSYFEDDQKRGFNHVVEIFKCLDLEMYTCLIKTENIKQKELNYEDRQKIGDILKFDQKFKVKNKKILIVDDVITTGASMKAAIKIMKKYGARKVKVLCLAKREIDETNTFSTKIKERL